MKQKQLDFRRGRAFRSFAALVCLLLLGVSGVRAQSQYEVSGVVTDRNAQPVAGASIVEKGTNRGTVTSANGSYTIRVSSDKAVLVYSFFGCQDPRARRHRTHADQRHTAGGCDRPRGGRRHRLRLDEEIRSHGRRLVDQIGTAREQAHRLVRQRPARPDSRCAGTPERRTAGGGERQSAFAERARSTAPTSRFM